MSYQDPPSTEVVPASGETTEETVEGEEPLIPSGSVIYPQNDPTISDAAREAVAKEIGAEVQPLEGESLAQREERLRREREEQVKASTSDV